MSVANRTILSSNQWKSPLTKILPSKDLVHISLHTDVLAAINTLSKHNISAAPVWDPTAKEWSGLIDYQSLTIWGLHFIEEGMKAKGMTLLYRDSKQFDEMLSKVTVQIVPKNRPPSLVATSPFFVIRSDQSMEDAFKLFGDLIRYTQTDSRTYSHRVCVVDKDNPDKIVGMLSQSDLIRFLFSHKHVPAVAKLLSLGVESLQQSFKPQNVLSVSADATLLAALKSMEKNGLTSCAIVDAQGAMVGSVSFSWVRSAVIEKHSFKNLGQSCREIYQTTLEAKDPRASLDVITIHSSATIGEVVQRIAQHGLHRLFVVDSQHKPISVVSLSDIIHFLTKE